MPPGTVIVLQKLSIGSVHPDELEFAAEMLDRFLHTLEAPALRPQAICFYTDGVRAACKGSPLLLGLQLLEGTGVDMLVCRTCLEHFGLLDSVAVGKIVTMKDIVATLTSAARVLYP